MLEKFLSYCFSVYADNNCLSLTDDESISLVFRMLTLIRLFCYGNFYASTLNSIDISGRRLVLLKSAFYFSAFDEVDKNDIESAFKIEAALNCNQNEYVSLCVRNPLKNTLYFIFLL